MQRRRSGWVCAVLCLAAGLTVSLAGAELADAVKSVRDAVVTVVVADGQGAGFVVNADGHVLTNQHVVGKATQVDVKLRSSDVLAAQIIKRAAERDLCLLKIDRTHLPAVQFASSSKLKQGEDVAAVGTPLGLENTLTKGIVSSTSREMDGRTYLQIDAALNPGNSGGPIINADGLVVGVATKVAKEAQGIGLAVPSDEVMTFLDEASVSYQVALGHGPAPAGAAPAPASEPGAMDGETAPAAPPPAPAVPEGPAPVASPLPWWGLLIAAAVLSFIVALITAAVVAGKAVRGSQPAPLMAPQATPYAPAAPAPRPVPAAAPPPQDDLSDIDIELR